MYIKGQLNHLDNVASFSIGFINLYFYFILIFFLEMSKQVPEESLYLLHRKTIVAQKTK